MKSRRLEQYLIKVIKNQNKGFLAKIIRVFLCILSWFYFIAVSIRNWAFDKGWLRRYYPPVPVVISIGNIVAGGTGKTPVTLMVAKEFYPNIPTAILTRGYRSRASRSSAPIWLSKGEGPMHQASACGDEPFLLSQNLPKTFVIVGRDRQEAAIMAAKAGAQVLIMDDGMQHRGLARDLEIVVMNGRDLFGQGHFLPLGFLREKRSALSRADLIILNHVDTAEEIKACKMQISPYCSKPVVGVTTKIVGIFDFKGEPVDGIRGKRIAFFCGIAHPENFEHTLVNEGAEIIAKHILADHQPFDLHALDKFAQQCLRQGAEMVVCTEKDKVKFTDSFRLALPVVWLQMELKIVDGLHEWDEFIAKAKRVL